MNHFSIRQAARTKMIDNMTDGRYSESLKLDSCDDLATLRRKAQEARIRMIDRQTDGRYSQSLPPAPTVPNQAPKQESPVQTRKATPSAPQNLSVTVYPFTTILTPVRQDSAYRLG